MRPTIATFVPSLALTLAVCLAGAGCTPGPASPVPPTPVATVGLPAAPTGVTFASETSRLPAVPGSEEVLYQVAHTVRWQPPGSAGVDVRIFGVTDCLAEPANPPPGSAGPCLLDDTTLAPPVLALAGAAPAAAGDFHWIAPFYYDCGGPPVGPDSLDYQAIVIAAANAAGQSAFVIAYPGEWRRAAPGEVSC